MTAPARGALGLASVFFVASAGTIQKYGGDGALAAYLAGLLACAWIGGPALTRLRRRLSDRAALAVAAAAFLVLVGALLVVYPRANRHGADVGTDRDDAADIGGRLLLHGRYPYDATTYLGQHVSQLPGALVIAAPFVAIGKSAYAALLWIPVLFGLLRLRFREWRTPLLLLLLALSLAPGLLRELVTGGDLIANGVLVLVACLLVLRARRVPAFALSALLLGFALSTRLNFMFVLPALLAAVVARRGWRLAASGAVLAAAAFAAVTLPFVLHSGRFWPFEASNHLQAFDGSLPGGGTTVAVAIGLAAAVAAAVPQRWSDTRFFAHATATQLALVLSVVILDSVRDATIDFSSLVPGYGVLALFFGLAAVRPARWGRA